MPQVEIEPKLLKSLQRRIHPRRYPGMSPKMMAIVGYIVGQKYTDPEIVEIKYGRDDIVYYRHEGDCGFNHMDSYTDFRNNWEQLLRVTPDLTPEEKALARQLYASQVLPI